VAVGSSDVRAATARLATAASPPRDTRSMETAPSTAANRAISKRRGSAVIMLAGELQNRVTGEAFLPLR
jgi:hypothetical protein